MDICNDKLFATMWLELGNDMVGIFKDSRIVYTIINERFGKSHKLNILINKICNNVDECRSKLDDIVGIFYPRTINVIPYSDISIVHIFYNNSIKYFINDNINEIFKKPLPKCITTEQLYYIQEYIIYVRKYFIMVNDKFSFEEYQNSINNLIRQLNKLELELQTITVNDTNIGDIVEYGI
jgi:hypothetical protein